MAGYLLQSLKSIGFNNLLGIDPFNPKNIEYSGNLKILKKSIHDIGGKWDLCLKMKKQL